MKFKKFKELLESPVAVIGDWDGFKVETDSITVRVLEKYWSLEDAIKFKRHALEIYSQNNTFILGTFGTENDKEVFVIFTRLKIIKRKDINVKLKYKNPIQIKKVETIKELRGQGYATFLYKWFLSKRYSIVSDIVQFDGARKIYDKLSKNQNINADLINDVDSIILKKNININSGKEDWDFDSNIWSYDFDKANIKLK